MPIALPNTIRYEDFDGSIEDYISHLYTIFREDFYSNQVFFLGKQVLAAKKPMDEGREFSFNHITKFDVKKPRVDYGRSKKIPWLSPLLNGCPDPDIKSWEERVKSSGRWVTRTNVWYERYGFLIVLEERKKRGVYYLITAYSATKPRDVAKYNRKYNNSSDKLL